MKNRMTRDELNRQIKKESLSTILLTAVCAAWHIICGFALNGNGQTILHMPQWFVVSVGGSGVIAIAGIIILTRKVFIDYDYDDEAAE